jgi:PleD family two-component response regulator
VLLPGIRAGQAKARLERILGELADRCYEYEADGAKRSVSWTTSCGVATFETKDTIEVFVSRTDQALYEAKRGGRNKVVARGASFLGGLLAR